MQEEKLSVSTTQVGLKFGVYSGIALALYGILMAELNLQEDTFLGFLGYVLLISAMHFGIADYKKSNEGYMTFGQGLGIGMLISTLTGLITGLSQSIYFYFKPAVIVEMKDQILKEYQRQNIPQEQIDFAMKMMDYVISPTGIFFAILISYVFFGLLLSLLVSAFTSKNPPLFDE